MRFFLSLLLTVGAVVGLGGGVARLHHGGRHHRDHRDHMMARVAETCVEAARNLDRQAGPPPRAATPQVGPQPIFVPYPVPMALPAATAPAAAPAQPAPAPAQAE
jgi:hypothetical protein